MSRLGKMPIDLPSGVEVKVDGKNIHVKGPKGTLSYPLTEGITIKVAEGQALVEKNEKIELPKPTHGLYRALLNTMIEGVSKGFEIKLSMVGVGYRAAIQGSNAHFGKYSIAYPVQRMTFHFRHIITARDTGIGQAGIGSNCSS